jgi:hypothetical protein
LRGPREGLEELGEGGSGGQGPAEILAKAREGAGHPLSHEDGSVSAKAGSSSGGAGGGESGGQ